MKNILVLNYEFPPLGGGASPVSFEIAKHLADSGQFEIDVVTMGYADLPKLEIITPNFRIHRVRCLRFKKETCGPLEQFIYVLAAFFYCRRILRSKVFHLCHCHFVLPTGLVAFVLKRFYKLGYILSAHGSDIPGYSTNLNTLHSLSGCLWWRIIRESKVITSPSADLSLSIQDRLPTELHPKVITIPHGIRSGLYNSPFWKEPLILSVNRLIVRKGTEDLIQALSKINIGDWKVKIIGDGPERGKLDKLINRLNLSDKVELVGWLDNGSNEMRQLYKRASVFISASHKDSFNITILEALQSGCIVLASNKNGLLHVVRDAGVKLSTFEAGNSDKLGKLLFRTLRNIREMEKFSNTNSAIIEKKFNWTKIAEKYSSLITQ